MWMVCTRSFKFKFPTITCFFLCDRQETILFFKMFRCETVKYVAVLTGLRIASFAYAFYRCWWRGLPAPLTSKTSPQFEHYIRGCLFALRISFISGNISVNVHLKQLLQQQFDLDATIRKNIWLRYISKMCLEMFT